MAASKPVNAHAFEREEHEWYVEPREASRMLFKAEQFHGLIIDPSCGQGNIVEEAIAAGYEDTVGSDIVRRVWKSWFAGEIDFLATGPDRTKIVEADNIIMNPPFYRGRGTESFIRRAIAVTRYKTACFAPLGFLSGAGRATGLFKEHPPTRIYMITPRLSCAPATLIRSGVKAEGGKTDWVWIVWSKDARTYETKFRWLVRG